MTDDPIERLAREGRELAKGDRVRTARAHDDEALDRERSREMQIGESVSRYARYGWIFLSILVGVACAIVTAFVVDKIAPGNPDAESSPAIGLGVLSGFLPGIVLYFTRRGHVRRAIERERAWSRSLPFRLSGYPEALGGRTEGRAALDISFSGAAPDEVTLAAVFRTAGARVSPGSKRVEYSVNGGDTSYSTNSHLAEFVHRAVDVLLTLHAKYPVTSVHVHEFQ